jgi:hypothetical protein
MKRLAVGDGAAAVATGGRRAVVGARGGGAV